MHKYDVSISTFAQEDIDDLADFYEDLVDKASADRFENDAFETINSLDTFPEGNPYWDEELDLRRVNLKKHKVSVVYTTDNDKFEVVAIATFHALQKPSKYSEQIIERLESKD
jgi:plasmid stabilization system protein ParE